jgi:rod shape-determining protein MreC
VLLERLRLNGVLKGTQSGYPEVLNVMADEKIEVGDKLITTGGDRVFPKGLPVGTIMSISPDRERDPFLSIRVKPAVNLGKLEEVLVVTQLSERDNPDTTSGPVRAADMLAQRLPSAKAKTEETPTGSAPESESPQSLAKKPATNPLPEKKAGNAPAPVKPKPTEKAKESPR